MDDSIMITTSMSATDYRPEERKNARNGAAAPITSPLRSEETFEAYCQQVQARIAEHAQQRRHFLQSAYDRLTQLLHTARAIEDTTLYNELWQVRVATRELLESLRLLSGSGAEYNGLPREAPSTRPNPMPASGDLRGRSESGNGSMEKPWQVTKESYSRPPMFTSGPPPGEAVVSAAPRVPRRPMRSLEEIEADAKRLRELCGVWKVQFPLLREEGGLHIPNCLRHRALICRLRKLEEEAGDTEVTEVTDAIDEMVALLDSSGDDEYTVALDDELTPPPTAFQWSEMGDRYEEMARAQEAFDWWFANQNTLPLTAVQPIAEAVAAVQQRFNRLLFRVGARDPYQQRLFDDLRQWARESQCYLHSLRPKVPIAELIERASTLEEALLRGREVLSVSTESVGCTEE